MKSYVEIIAENMGNLTYSDQKVIIESADWHDEQASSHADMETHHTEQERKAKSRQAQNAHARAAQAHEYAQGAHDAAAAAHDGAGGDVKEYTAKAKAASHMADLQTQRAKAAHEKHG